jgi:hypothetical protein
VKFLIKILLKHVSLKCWVVSEIQGVTTLKTVLFNRNHCLSLTSLSKQNANGQHPPHSKDTYSATVRHPASTASLDVSAPKFCKYCTSTPPSSHVFQTPPIIPKDLTNSEAFVKNLYYRTFHGEGCLALCNALKMVTLCQLFLTVYSTNLDRAS